MELNDFLPILMMGGSGRSGWLMAVVAIATMVMNLMERLRIDQLIAARLKTFLDVLFATKVKYELTAECTCDQEPRITSAFAAVAFYADDYLKSSTCKDAWKEVSSVKELDICTKGVKVNLFLGRVSMPEHGVDMRVEYMEDFMGDKKDRRFMKWTMELSAVSYKVITDFVEKCTEAMDKHLDDSTNARNQMMYTVREVRQSFVRYTIQRFRTTKTFDNLFFPGKADMLRTLDRFENDPESYSRIGKPYKQFWMFHSGPGGGKTSAVKAIASKTGRHVVVLSIDKFRTVSELCDCIASFPSENSVPLSRCMFVIEEFDCWTAKPNREPVRRCDDVPRMSDGQHLVAALRDINTGAPEKPVETPETATGIMLNMFDGIKEMHGAMVIFTSNRPELFDPALTRPGRIDKFEFKSLSARHVNEYWRLHVGTDVPDELRDLMAGLTEFITVAQLSAVLDARDPGAAMRAFLETRSS